MLKYLPFISIVLFAYGSPNDKAVLPTKKGYAIMPAKWAVVRCKDENLTYVISGKEEEVRLPHRIRKELQKEYERVRKPSDDAATKDIETVFGPLNLIREKKQTLWVVPVHLKKGGHAFVYVQNADGTFEEGRFELGKSK